MADINKCCICGNLIIGGGHDPSPLINDDYYHTKVCCDYCYTTKVIPFTIRTSTPGRAFSFSAGINEGPDGKLILSDILLCESVPYNDDDE